MRLSAPAVPLLCNGTGGWMEAATACDARYWAAFLRRRRALVFLSEMAQNKTFFIEVGSGNALAPLLAECGRRPISRRFRRRSRRRTPAAAFAEAGLVHRATCPSTTTSRSPRRLLWRQVHQRH